MRTLSTLWARFCVWFETIPAPVKVAIFVGLNATFSMLSEDLKELDANKYLNVWIGAGANILSWGALYFGSKTDRAEEIKAQKK